MPESETYLSLNLDAGDKLEWPSPGLCIYCGATDVPLADEHIVPKALTGNGVIFRKASCKACEGIINPFEQFVLRRTYGNLRVQIDAPTRRPKDRKMTIDHPFILLDEHRRVKGRWTVQTAWNKSPVLCPSWVAPWPGLLVGRDPSPIVAGQKWLYEDHLLDAFIHKVRRFFQAHGAMYEAGKIDGGGFLRFIAKMAHGYAVATKGYESFDWLTQGIILGTDPNISHLVGGEPHVPPGDKETGAAVKFEVGEPTDELPYLLIKVRLFEFLGTPEHIVVVGRRRAD